ncbi:MAG TPA: GNAT family N-acetyltransferase [Longimicrobiales bacterium]|nr:GNAT family N-acetyltransferase [Longimicrobiales bacterium]
MEMELAHVIMRPMVHQDWPRVRWIYQQGIETGFATFETGAPEWKEWNRAHLRNCRIVAELKNLIVGWAALSAVSGRFAYGGVAEVSIYVDPEYHGHGIGSRLMRRLIKESEAAGVWTLQAGIFPENVRSLDLARRAGFRVVGVRKRIGKLNGRWRDVVLLERRSERVGQT